LHHGCVIAHAQFNRDYRGDVRVPASLDHRLSRRAQVNASATSDPAVLFHYGIVGIIYAQMHRDATLSLLTDTKAGELGRDFWLRITAFAAVPLLSLVLAQFPDVSAFLFSWLQPAMQALNH